SRVFNVSGGTAENPVELIGLTVTGAYGDLGGAFYSTGVLSVASCRVVGNTAVRAGGGFYSLGTTTIENCTISDNTTTEAGGGFYSLGTATLANVLIANNKTTSYYGGGGCYFDAGAATLRNCTIVGNYGIYGGGLRANVPATLYNTIVAQNTGSNGDVFIYHSGRLTAYNVLSSYTAWAAGSNNYVYNVSLPLFTDAANGDYTLAEGSQAINKGNDAYAVDAQGNPLTTDLAGNSRFSGSSVDLGAYEYTSPSVAPETIRTIGDVSAAFGETVEINLAQYFSDGDWTYSVKTPETLSDALVVAPVVEGDVLTLKFLAQANYLLDLDLSDVELVVVASTADGSASVDSNVFTVGLTDRYSARLAAVLTGLTTDDAYDYEMGKGRNKYYGAEEIPASDAANVVAGSPISLQLWSEDLSAKHGLTLESNVAFTFVLTLENATLDLNDTYGDDGYYAEFFGATGSYVKTSEDAGYEALGENEYWISVLYNYREKAHGVQTPATLLASLPVIPNGEGAVSATLQPWTDVRDPLVYRCFNGVSCEVDRSQVELLGASSADVVSEAFAELFVEEDAEDDFWFELEKALGNRR
ncbi:MAG: right-handed parallel beta-helix repeat-containing protein, partial [Thermoguttaceae bacterium]|nr:right-handed parallel beta-helix repeat-containing protein [Thermoguttaceae bacterium]